MKTQKFVLVCQNRDAVKPDYLVKMERLSRDAELVTTEDSRKDISMVLQYTRKVN